MLDSLNNEGNFAREEWRASNQRTITLIHQRPQIKRTTSFGTIGNTSR